MKVINRDFEMGIGSGNEISDAVHAVCILLLYSLSLSEAGGGSVFALNQNIYSLFTQF